MPNQFDTISRLFARRRSAPASIPTPATPRPGADHGPEMMFVQSFQSGRIDPREDTPGRYTVTLDHGLGQTIYFSDRPDRIAGSAPTAAFLDGLGFSEDNPPNAAILTRTGEGDTTLAIVELFDPVYDAGTATLTYDVALLDHWEDRADTGFSETPVDLEALEASFGATHLFIDDCADGEIRCQHDLSGDIVGTFPNDTHDGFCFSWEAFQCLPCQPWIASRYDAYAYWGQACNERIPECGGKNCEAQNV